jgi:hypothetical protein
MNRGGKMGNRYCIVTAVMILLISGCGSSMPDSEADTEEEFLLAEGQRMELGETGITVEILQIIDGLDGSQEIGAGSVYLILTDGEGQQEEVYLETGYSKQSGEHVIRFIEVLMDQEGLQVKLSVE